MTAPVGTDAERAFAVVVARLLPEPDVGQGTAFHAPALKVGGKIFAMLVKEELVLKLPAARCAEVVAAGAARPFESGGRRMREWNSIGDPDPQAWLGLAEEALTFSRR